MSADSLSATLRLGVVVSSVAALLAVALTFLGEVSEWRLAAVVATVGFALSWVQVGRIDRGDQPILTRQFAPVLTRSLPDRSGDQPLD